MDTHAIRSDDIVIVFADLQEGIVNVGLTNDGQRLRLRVTALADLALAFSIPVVISCVPTTGGTVAPVLSEIAARLPAATGLVRATANAMDDPPFRAAIESTGRKTLIVAGVATEVVVRLTALTAHDLGYRTIIAVDACSGLDGRTESAAFTHLSAQGVEVSAVATIAAQLAGDFTSTGGRAAMRVLQSTLTVHRHEHDHPPG